MTTARVALRGPAGVYLGNLAEWYDFAIFAASAAALATVVAAGSGGLTSVFVVLAAALLIRPMGAVLVGRLSDRSGRRVPFVVMTLLTSGATAAVGLLPSAATAGMAAVLGLAALRSVQAFATGGQTSTSVAYLFEEAARTRRGLYGGLYLSSAAAGMACGVAAALLVQVVLTPAQFLGWGWRLPFLAAMPMAVLVFWLRRRLEESPAFDPAHTAAGLAKGAPFGPEHLALRLDSSNVLALVRRRPLTVMAGVLLGGAFSATVNLWFVYIPAHLLATGRATAATALGPPAAGLLTCAVLAPLAGAFSDRLGRLPVLMAACAALALLSPAAFPTAMTGASWIFFTLASMLIGAALSAFVLASYLPEQFGTRDRATGVGLTYGIGSGVLGGLAPLIATLFTASGHPSGIAALPVLCAVSAATLVWFTHQRGRSSPGRTGLGGSRRTLGAGPADHAK